MKWRLFYIVFAAMVGLFLVPGVSLACGAKNAAAEKAKCSKDKSKKAHHKTLLATRSCDGKSGQSPCNKECGGKCGHDACKCITHTFGPAIAAPQRVNSSDQFSTAGNTGSRFRSAHVSPGFCSIWLPPKINWALT